MRLLFYFLSQFIVSHFITLCMLRGRLVSNITEIPWVVMIKSSKDNVQIGCKMIFVNILFNISVVLDENNELLVGICSGILISDKHVLSAAHCFENCVCYFDCDTEQDCRYVIVYCMYSTYYVTTVGRECSRNIQTKMISFQMDFTQSYYCTTFWRNT